MSAIIERAAQESWNPGLQDHFAFYEADPHGFFVGELNGQPIAHISAVNYNDEYGFIGLYIVSKDYRGKGYGLALWNHAVRRIQHLACGLDGVPDQIENYKKSGFVYAFRQMRLACTALAVPKPDLVYELVPESPILNLIHYDTAIFGTARENFCRTWLTMSNAKAFYTTAQNDNITGYAVIRKCIEGYKIGPLFAANSVIAENLFLACHSAASSGETVYIDMPEVNPSTRKFIERYALELVFETARMYTRQKPEILIDHVFSVTTFELG
ncbi:MAG TPA: GNAT family N-acetyltransferase [Sphingobacterium sp.]|nr:GNAT family N-acetyltransferase [Sphingobacterium sp.]